MHLHEELEVYAFNHIVCFTRCGLQTTAHSFRAHGASVDGWMLSETQWLHENDVVRGQDLIGPSFPFADTRDRPCTCAVKDEDVYGAVVVAGSQQFVLVRHAVDYSKVLSDVEGCVVVD